jgi:hypothetical protein
MLTAIVVSTSIFDVVEATISSFKIDAIGRGNGHLPFHQMCACDLDRYIVFHEGQIIGKVPKMAKKEQHVASCST